ncbi:hypothetical protein CRUP_022277, partial [Coryphaenoides rupestris]
MQVSFACTEHNLKSRSEDRLCGLRTAPPPGGGGGGGQGHNGTYITQGSAKIMRDSRPTTQGTWVTFGSQISDETAENLMTIAYENGVNLFDTAEVYASGR